MKEKRDWYDYTIGIFLVIIAAVIPLFVHYTRVDISVSESVVRNGDVVADVFSYYKSQMICFCAFCMAILFLLYVPEKGIKKYEFKHPVFFCGIAFVLFTVISLIMTPYKDIALKGISERFESVWVLISYMVFMIVSFKYCNTKFGMRFFVFGLFAGIFIIGIVGLFQYFGMDFFETVAGTKYLLGDLYKEGGEPIKANFDEVYSFLYNPNCAGMFCAMTLPFTSALAISLPFKEKDGFLTNIIIKAAAAVLSVILVYNLIGSSSEGGMIATIGAFFMGIIVAVVYVIKNKKYRENSSVLIIAIIAVVFIIGAVAAVLSNEQIKQKISQTVNMLTGREQSISTVYFQDFYIDKDKNKIEFSIFENNEFHKLFIEYDENSKRLQVSDDGGIIYPFEKCLFTVDGILEKANGNSAYTIDLKTTVGTGFKFIVYLRKNNTIPFFDINQGNMSMHFTLSKEGVISLTNNKYEIYDPDKKAVKAGFDGKERFASGRGYIWSRSIPLIFGGEQENNTEGEAESGLFNLLRSNIITAIFVGNGPDAFTLAFPQYEIREKLAYLDSPYIIVDKPHNFYLQTGINTGFLSLVSLIVLFVMYIYRTIRNIFKYNVKDRFIISLRFAFLMGITGYLISALATDSVVSVAPTFWIMLGIGFAVTEYNGERKSKENNSL